MSCLLCGYDAKYKEATDNDRLFCNRICQRLCYVLTEGSVKEDVMERMMQEDVSPEDVFKICTGNSKVAEICNNDSFRLAYYRKWRAKVDEFVVKAYREGRYEQVEFWKSVLLKTNSDGSQF